MIDDNDINFTPDELRAWVQSAQLDSRRNSYAWMVLRLIRFIEVRHPDLAWSIDDDNNNDDASRMF